VNDDLLVRYLLDEVSIKERNLVDIWISAKPENRRYFDHFKIIWDASKQVSMPENINEEEAWERLQTRIKNAKPHSAKVRRMIRSSSWRSIAAVILLGLGLLSLAYIYFDRMASPVVVVSENRSLSQTLPDGSVVTLNRHSSISFNRNLRGNKRLVKLSGEAFFQVTHNPQRPFVIDVNDVIVTVVGTSFNINGKSGNTEVVVETGIVKVTKNGKTIELKAGERTIVSKTSASLLKEDNSDKLYQYYRSKVFVCDKTPLWKLVEVLNEAYDANIVIGRKELRNLPLTTTFSDEPLDNILNIISQTFDINIIKHQQLIILN
jgi:transmembrane sensor